MQFRSTAEYLRIDSVQLQACSFTRNPEQDKMQGFMLQNIFNLVLMKFTENIDYTVARVENAVDRRKLKDKLQGFCHLELILLSTLGFLGLQLPYQRKLWTNRYMWNASISEIYQFVRLQPQQIKHCVSHIETKAVS